MIGVTHGPLLLTFGISHNPRRIRDIAHARRVLGYEPQDAAPALMGDEEESQTY